MKKLWMLLIVLALLVTTVPIFASDVTFSGRNIWAANATFDPIDSVPTLIRFRPTLTAKIDDFNTLVAGFRMEGQFLVSGNPGVRVRDMYVTTDVTGALGLKLPVTIKTTVGQFEADFTDWNYVSESGWESYYDWPNGIADLGPYDVQTAARVDIGIVPAANFHLYADMVGGMMFGLNGAIGPAVYWLTYQAPAAGFGEGVLGVEAKYSGEFGDFKVGVPAFFRYKLGNASDGVLPEDWTAGLGLSGDYKMFHVAAGMEADSESFPDNVVIDVGVKPVDKLQVKVNTYLDMGAASDNAFAAMDLQANYMLGAAKFMLGYVFGGADGTAIPINGDTFNIATGLYFALDVSF